MATDPPLLRESRGHTAVSGTGKNLGDASKACYLETRKGGVALISVSSTFSAASRAGGQSHQMIGRPGLNPLTFLDQIPCGSGRL